MKQQSKQQRLGRGLGALINMDIDLEASTSPSGIEEVDIMLLDPNKDQARKEFDEEKINELAASIKEHGVIQPVIVRQSGDRYTIIAGERRWRAAGKAGLKSIPVIVKELDDRELMEISLIENLQRVDLNPIEEASGIRMLMDEYSLTQEQVSKRIGKSRPAIANALRLLSLCEDVIKMVSDGALSAGHARCLVPLSQEMALELAQKAVKEQLSVRELERLAQLAQQPQQKERKVAERDVELDKFESELRARFGTKVSIKGDMRRGSIVINYYDREGLERIYDSLS
ncbi:MAG: ParB/RepB/Spo0J family partition protein [Christensenellales bacterium]|jgi:ParB family chromosome partitioning protein